MSIYNSEIWIEDIDRVITANPWITGLSGKSVMITGISGLVCSPIADILIRYNETKRTNEKYITILAAGRSKARICNRFGVYAEKEYFHYVKYDANDYACDLSVHADFIIHGASNSSPDRITIEPVETMLSNFIGLFGLLKYAKENGTSRVLYISSSEVYGSKEGNEPYREDQYGYIDLLKARNSYSVGKRAAETLCASFNDEYDVESVIIRPGHIYGPTATEEDGHVSSQWAYAAARGEDIVMKSDGSQLRSYVHCLDSASAILTVLVKGERNHAYNVSNPKSLISIKQMAELFSKSANVELRMELPTDAEKRGFNPMSNSSLDGSSLIELGWISCFNAEIGFTHTVNILKEMLC